MEKFSLKTPEVPLENLVVPPAIETLRHPTNLGSFWDETIRNNAELQDQAALREKLLYTLKAFFERVPQVETSLVQALESELLLPQEAGALYTELTEFLEQDPENAALILYLPFELIPQAEELEKKFSEVQPAATRFLSAFKRAWEQLLNRSDFRADFADGDISEPEYRQSHLPRVIKAAHLIPVLTERGLLTTQEILTLMEETDDALLAESIADTLPVLADKDPLSTSDLNRMKHSENRLVSRMAIILEKNQASQKMELHPQTATLEDSFSNFDTGMGKILQRFTPKDPAQSLHPRERWLQSVSQEKLIAEEADQLMPLLLKEEGVGSLTQYLVAHPTTEHNLLAVEAIRKTLLSSARQDIEKASSLYTLYQPLLLRLRSEEIPVLQDSVRKLFFHLHTARIITTEDLHTLGLEAPKLDASFETRQGALETEARTAHALTQAIAGHPELSQQLYPVAILIGSKMKGYAKTKTDFDVAVFVRPGTMEEARQKLQTQLTEIFEQQGIDGSAMEFWLEEEDESLSIRDYENPDPHRGDSTLPHPLLGAWYGDQKAIAELYKKLMPGYLYSKGKEILGEDARQIWLKGMEHDILQYRLMHKGYREFFPSQGGISTPHANDIDGDSAFYDSGYRRLATKLFIDKVFLPQLTRP